MQGVHACVRTRTTPKLTTTPPYCDDTTAAATTAVDGRTDNKTEQIKTTDARDAAVAVRVLPVELLLVGRVVGLELELHVGDVTVLVGVQEAEDVVAACAAE